MRDHAGVERLTPASGSSASIEDVGDLGIRVVVQQLADFGDEHGGKVWAGCSAACRETSSSRVAPPRKRTPGMGTIVMSGQGDVLDQQGGSCAFSRGSASRGSFPQSGEVRREFQNALANRLIEQYPVLAAEAVSFGFGVSQCLQAPVPFALENIGDEPVSGIDFHEAALGQFGRPRGYAVRIARARRRFHRRAPAFSA